MSEAGYQMTPRGVGAEGADYAPQVYAVHKASQVLITVEHASNFIPPEYGTLGLEPELLREHIAWDPGALPVARAMGNLLSAPVVAAGASRLLVDVNRVESAHDLMPKRSGGIDVPGNAEISEVERASRLAAFHGPYHAAVDRELDRMLAAGVRPAVISVHSFTPLFDGRPRAVEIGILNGEGDGDLAWAEAVCAGLAQSAGRDVRLNEPYAASDGVLYSVGRHATMRGLPGLMIEIRNDLIATEADQKQMAAWLSQWVLKGLIRKQGAT